MDILYFEALEILEQNTDVYTMISTLECIVGIMILIAVPQHKMGKCQND